MEAIVSRAIDIIKGFYAIDETAIRTTGNHGSSIQLCCCALTGVTETVSVHGAVQRIYPFPRLSAMEVEGIMARKMRNKELQ